MGTIWLMSIKLSTSVMSFFRDMHLQFSIIMMMIRIITVITIIIIIIIIIIIFKIILHVISFFTTNG